MFDIDFLPFLGANEVSVRILWWLVSYIVVEILQNVGTLILSCKPTHSPIDYFVFSPWVHHYMV